MVEENNLEKGISAIIPTYKGEAFISKLLDSLINQSIDPKLFEADLPAVCLTEPNPQWYSSYEPSSSWPR